MCTTACTIGEEFSGSPMSMMKLRSKAVQVAQRRMAGAEIVERDARAELAQLLQDRQRLLVVADQHALRDLELKPSGREPRLRDGKTDKTPLPAKVRER